MGITNAAGYGLGECTWFVAMSLNWVGRWGNAADWLVGAARDGDRVVGAPLTGSIAVWRPYQGGAGQYGHVALVTGVQPNNLPIVQEMNWNAWNQVDTRNVSASSAAGIGGYILPPGSSLVGIGSPAAGPAATPVVDSMPAASMAGVTSTWDQFRFWIKYGAPTHHNDLATIADNHRRIG